MSQKKKTAPPPPAAIPESKLAYTADVDIRVDRSTPYKFRVWWIPQIPMQPFTILVDTLVQAKSILTVLGKYDLFQFVKNIKPDFSNGGGLDMLEDDEWTEWYDTSGNNIDLLTMEECVDLDRGATNA